MKQKQRLLDDLILELVDDPEKGGWIIIPASGKGIPASCFEICLWKEILRLRTKIVYLKARLENYESN